MRAVTLVIVGAALLAGCQSAQRDGSWAGRQWGAFEQEIESLPATLSKEGMRHYAAATILLVLVAGCWTRVKSVKRRHAAAVVEEETSAEAEERSEG